MRFFLEGPIPSKKNGKMFNIKAKRLFSSAAYQSWEKRAAWEVKTQLEGQGPIVGPVRIDIDLRYANKRRRDTINQAEGILDLLVKMEVIPDDNWKCVPDLRLSGRLTSDPEEKEGAEIHITPYAGVPCPSA